MYSYCLFLNLSFSIFFSVSSALIPTIPTQHIPQDLPLQLRTPTPTPPIQPTPTQPTPPSQTQPSTQSAQPENASKKEHKPQPVATNYDALVSVLESKMKQKKLVDLHTHFMGMGRAEFWRNQVEFYAESSNCDPIEVYDVTNATHENFAEQVPLETFSADAQFRRWVQRQIKSDDNTYVDEGVREAYARGDIEGCTITSEVVIPLKWLLDLFTDKPQVSQTLTFLLRAISIHN